MPDVSAASIVFVYGGDIWTVPRDGGIARRLTANPSLKRMPKFSPDGKWIAFTGNYDGNTDVYVIPSEGGVPKRLTYHPAGSIVVGWTPDSKQVLFMSGRTSFSYRFTKLFTVPITGGLPHELPMPQGSLASYSPDGTQIAYNRQDRAYATWKRYRGGDQAYVSIYNLNTNGYSELPHGDETDFYPMWHGDRIYFASDRTFTVNLFYYDLRTHATKQLTHYSGIDVKWPSMGPDAIVFERDGTLHLLDLATEKVKDLTIHAYSDMASARPELKHVEGEVTDFGISPSGQRAVFCAHGDVFTVPAQHGETLDITNSPGVRDTSAVWSPDGKWIAYLSDGSGEYEIYVRPQEGSGKEERVTTDGHVFRNGPVWSPDSKALLYSNADDHLYVVTLARKTPQLVDTDVTFYSDGGWSPDSKWIAYVKRGDNRLGKLMLYSLDQKKSYTVSDGQFDDSWPVFDKNGKYLYFVSDRTFTPSLMAPEINIDLQNTAGIYGLVLQASEPSPLAPRSDEEKPQAAPPSPPGGPPPPQPPKKSEPNPAPKAPAVAPTGAATAPASSKPVKIDPDGLYGRVFAIPVPAGQYAALEGGDGSVFYLSHGALHSYAVSDRADKTLISGIQAYDMNPARTKILYQAGGGVYGIVGPVPGQMAGAGKLSLDLEMQTDPAAEWKEEFRDAWRFERDFYYDPNMKGLDWQGMYNRYAALVPYVADRDDLTYLLGELVGELNTSHSYVMGAQPPPTPHVSVGLLGVDYEPDGAYYRIKKIYPGENWDPARRSPLTEPGVNVKEGDYLIAVNGVPVHTDRSPYAAFIGLADKLITIRVNSKPSDAGARDVQVRPIGSEGGVRYLDWVEGNAKKVADATGGRVGYMHIEDTSIPGMTEFGRGFYSQTDKVAMIVDERFNSGGFIPDFFAEKLARKLLMIGTPRYGPDFKSPSGAIYGPKVILENAESGSGGDAFPYDFRKIGAGPIIGERTWGGLVGINGFRRLMDGGGVTVPQFGLWSPQDGKWVAENHGIDPDIPVDNRPDLVHEGHDPQLERAIAYILEQLKKNPPPKYHHPPFPVEKLPQAGP